MRTLSESLLRAQQSASMAPFVRVSLAQRSAAWTRLYAGVEPAGFHGAAMPGDGSLIRARSMDGNLYLQRVGNPSPGSDFSAWTLLVSGISPVSGIALCARGSSVFLFYAAADGRTIYCRESSDNGLVFSPAVVAAVTGADVGYLAAADDGNGTLALFLNAGNYVSVARRTHGIWTANAQWPNGYIGCTGLAVGYAGDWNLLITGGQSATGYALWQCIFGNGYALPAGTWSGLTAVQKSSGGLGVEFHYPALVYADTFRAAFEERYLGSGSYSRPFLTSIPPSGNFNMAGWREPMPFDLNTSFGIALCASTSYLWLSNASDVWRSSLANGTGTEVSEDVLLLNSTILPYEGSALVELRNDDGRYGSPAAGGTGNICKGAELTFELGYLTDSGPEVGPGLSYRVESLAYSRNSGGSRLAILAKNGWHLLKTWQAKRQLSWNGDTTIFGVLFDIFARAGVEFTALSYSSRLMEDKPFFTISPGESAFGSVRRLLESVEDRILFRGNRACAVYPQGSDPPVYDYGIAHPFWEGRYMEQGLVANHVQVWGRNTFGEAIAWPEMDLFAGRLTVVRDHNLTNAVAARNRAESILRNETLTAHNGHIRVPVNCGQELYDVISICDPATGATPFYRRVLGMTTTFEREPGARYQMKLDLGGV